MATTAKIITDTKAIIDPLPVLFSAEKYSPRNNVINPNTWLQIRLVLKLLDTCWAVAAGVTSNAVANNVPVIFTMLTTTKAVRILNHNPMTSQADLVPLLTQDQVKLPKALYSANIDIKVITKIMIMRFKLWLSTNNKLPNM